MKTLVVWTLQQREWRIARRVAIGLLASVLVALSGLVACNDKDTAERTSASKTAPGQQTSAQKPAEKPDADEGEEGEEGPATPAAVAAEKPAPQQSAGKQFA